MGRSEAQLDQAQHDSAYLRGIRYPRTTEGAKPEGDQISTEGARPEGDQVPTEGARPEMGAGAETSTEGAEPERTRRNSKLKIKQCCLDIVQVSD